MVYNPEHLTDLVLGSIIQVEIGAGDIGNCEGFCARVCVDSKQQKVGNNLTTDEGCFSLEEECAPQGGGISTIMSDPHASQRREDKLCKFGRQTLRKPLVAVQSKSGKALLRKWGEHHERSSIHVLDQGGMTRGTQRGREILTKRLTHPALAYNLSLLMRKHFGFGTPKQLAAKACFFVFWQVKAVLGRITGLYQ